MKVVLSDKFQDKWDNYLDYSFQNYGKALTSKKNEHLIKILSRLSIFPESGHIEPLLKNKDKEYRAIIFDKKFKIIYSIGNNQILIVSLWDMKRNPKELKKDI